MCNSLAEGGRRCSTHTRPDAYAAFAFRKQSGGALTPNVLDKLLPATLAYASTRKGRDDLISLVRALEGSENQKALLNDDDTAFVVLLKDSISKGKTLEDEAATREAEIKAQIELLASSTAPEALTHNDRTYSELSLAIALGAEIPALPGAAIYDVHASSGHYDDWHEWSQGLYPTEAGAKKALLMCIYRDTQYEVYAPWGIRPEDENEQIPFDSPWYVAQKEWFQANDFDTIVAWYQGSATYGSYDGVTYKIERVGINDDPELTYDLPTAPVE